MTEPVDQPLLGDDPKPKPAKRRTTAIAKPRTAAKTSTAKKAKADEEPEVTGAVATKAAEAESTIDAKPKARKAAVPRKKKTADAEPATLNGESAPLENGSSNGAAHDHERPIAAELPGLESDAAPSRRRAPAARKPKPAPPVMHGEGEEWRPSARTAPASAPTPSREPAPASPAPAAESSPAPSAEAAPRAPAAPARKYPVYIPRHVAKQMEEQGQAAPLAVSLDSVPENARAAVEAAQAAHAERVAHHAHRTAERQEAHQRGDRPERGPRPERGERPPQGDRDRGPRERPERHDRHNRDDRNDRGDRNERGDRGDHNDRNDRGDLGEGRQLPELSPDEELGQAEGIVEISGKGFGFIRDAKRGYAQHPSDVFVTPEHVRRYNLRDGQWLTGETRRGVRGAQLHRIVTINGDEPEKARTLPVFEELTVISPMERILMETTPERNTTRLIDLFTPIGKGQRGLIVAPPRTGKTTLLQHIAEALEKKHPEITLVVLLVDERPEEVTDIKRTLPTAQVMASSNDSDVKSHTRIAQLAIERAKRLVESGKDVFVLLDSITRVGRAFNNAMAGGGRTMSGGVDARALEIPRRLFAAARNTEEAGSLTIIATALIETGSRMDELIFQEFKGTGNMEIVLDRKIADQRIYPAIDMFQSGTRREELLIPADDLHKINILRRGLAGHKPMEAIDRLLFFLRKFPTNAQMLKEIPG